MGYANEVGEAFRALVHVNWVRLSYGVASAYVLADTNDKSRKTAASLPLNEEGRSAKIVAAAFDTLLWQALASVMIPGFVINRICAGSLYTMARTIPQVWIILLLQHLIIPCFKGDRLAIDTTLFFSFTGCRSETEMDHNWDWARSYSFYCAPDWFLRACDYG